MYDVVIIGGGLAGLTNAIQLSKAGINTLVIEKNTYPFHRVCGEYISNEVKPFLLSLGIDLTPYNPSSIKRLQVSSPSGTVLESSLDLGGFGISRYRLDEILYKKAIENGCSFLLNTQVLNCEYKENNFLVSLSNNTLISSKLVIGSFGKRSGLDRQLERSFFYKRSPYIGVKYHIKLDFPKDLIALHNFKDGYCGISAIENDTYCLCYLTTRDNLKKHGTIPEMEKNILFKNKHLKTIFENGTFLFEKPETINEISFEKKSTIEKHILMSGDSAGMIAPLCGNGMSMAIHSAKLLSESILRNYTNKTFPLYQIEKEYTSKWNKTFAKRIYIGRKIQQLFGQETTTDLVVKTLQKVPLLTRWVIKQTHGNEF